MVQHHTDELKEELVIIPIMFERDFIKCPYCGSKMIMTAENETEEKIKIKLDCENQKSCAYGCNLGYVKKLNQTDTEQLF